MDTNNYRTRTIFMEADNRKVGGIWPVGLDIGYSGVKTFSGNAITCFPAYAAESMGQSRISVAGTGDTRNIQYRDENGVVWDVGAGAQNRISVSDTSAGSLAIYGRSRYYSPMYKVIMRVGIACGIRKNACGNPAGKTLKIQTGLPPKYMASDTADLLDVMCGHHEFEVRFGDEPWEPFSFTLGREDVALIDQPEGTLFSISTDRNMKLMPDAVRYFSSRMLIIDPGFGTMDMFPMIRQTVNRDLCQTFPELSMKQVLKDTADEIFQRYNFEVAVPAMQQFLESGQIIKREGRKYSRVPFGDILEKHSMKICNQAIDRIMEIYNPPVEFDYLVLTGGTGEAWKDYFTNNEYLQDCETVTILPGNQGDPTLPYLLSNVRGYFIYALSRFAAQA
ncbi:MAG: ParM/StbA family protein [Clostridiales bacterium]|nr:ParM/StbA family protein [Clostridiales bacterium]